MGTSIDYSTVSHETIYQHVTGGPGSAALMDTSRGWQSIAAKLQELQGLVDQAVQGIGAAQQGAAADAATHSTTALTPWIADAATAAKGVAARVCEQAIAFAHTRDNMPPPRAVPEVPFNQDPATWMGEHAVEWLPGIQTEHERAQVAAQQDEQRARELMSGYQGTSNENVALREHFAMAPTVVAEVADPAPGGAGVGGNGAWSAQPGGAQPGSVQSAPAPSAAARPAVTYSDAHSALAHPGAGAGGEGTLAPAATASQLASNLPPAVPTTSQLAGGYPGAGQQSMAGAVPFGSPTFIGAGAGSGDRTRGGARFSGGASRGGGFGPRPTAAFGSGEPRAWSSTAYDTPGHNSLEHVSAEHAGGDRSARGGGWGDAPLGGVGGAGRDSGSSEHRRPSYLIEQDTNAIVGELPRVAPPVIGADEDYR
jgi:hypothetical protein